MEMNLLQKKIETDWIKSFVFKKPKNFSFLPGQFIYLTLPKLKYPDKRGPTRAFTISSSPTEENLMITTKIRPESGFKKTLDEIKIGESINAKGPMGDFTLHKKSNKKHIFLAGGIGITPFRSIIKYHQDKKIKNKIHLVLSAKTIKDIPFKKDLDNWQKKMIAQVSITLTEETSKNWSGMTGRLDNRKIEKLVSKSDIKNSIFWICGPPAFVSTMEKILSDLKIKEENIISEKFTGY